VSEGVDLAALQDVDAFQSILSDLSAETRNLLCDLVEEGDAMQSDAQTAVECDRDVQDAEFEAEGLDDLVFNGFQKPVPARAADGVGVPGQPASSSSSSGAAPERMVCRGGMSHSSVWDIAKKVGLEWKFAGTALQFNRPCGRSMGRLWFIGDLSVKAMCGVHSKCSPKCALFIDVINKSGVQLRSCSDVIKKVLEWMALADRLSPEEHRKEAVAVKVSLGMKPRASA